MVCVQYYGGFWKMDKFPNFRLIASNTILTLNLYYFVELKMREREKAWKNNFVLNVRIRFNSDSDSNS